MKKLFLSLVVCGTILGVGISNVEYANAAHKTVEYGESWTYGSEIVLKGRRGYSNLASTSRWHSSSVTIGEGSAMSGNTKPGVESKASRISGYTAKGHYYYNIL